MKTFIKLTLAVCVAIAFTGCIEVEDILTVRKDGTGTWKFTMSLGPQMVAMMESGANANKTKAIMNEAEFRKAVAKIKGVRVVSYSREIGKDKVGASFEIAFDSIAELYQSTDFAEQLEWQFKRVGKELEVTTGKGQIGSKSDLTSQMMFKSVKGLMMGLKMDRTLVLPNPVGENNGEKVSANRVRWLFEMKSGTTEDEFNNAFKLKPMARCSAAGVGFKLPLKPNDGQRPDIKEFKSAPVAVGAKLDGVQANPYRASVTRQRRYQEEKTLFFGGESLFLTMRVTWPETIRPTAWSHVQIESAADDSGTDMKPPGSRREERVQDLRLVNGKEQTSEINVSFGMPAREARKFSAKGSLILHVPSRLTPIKVPNVKSLVGKQIDVEGLRDLELKVKSFSGTRLELESSKDLASITDVKLLSGDLQNEEKRFYINRSNFRSTWRLSVGFQSAAQKLTDPVLVIVVAGEVGKHVVPFEFTDLELP